MSRALDGKRALVTGAASGIGRAIAQAFAAEGATLALADRAACGDVADTIAAAGGRAVPIAMDVTDEASVTDATAEAARALGGLDLAVLAAGIADERPLLETTLADFERVIAVNLAGVFLTGREAVRAMAGEGRVIAIASDHAFFGWEGRSAYNASKAGVLGLVRCWAKELGPGILVNAICPGPIETPLLMETMTPEIMARETDIPLARIGRPEEVAAVALALAGAAGSYVTGQAWGVNGGSAMP